MENKTRGVIYVATGQDHFDVACRSAKSVRKHNPNLGLTIFSDIVATDSPFDTIVPVENPHIRSKVDYLPRTPYDETLYLDGDTLVRHDLTSMFDVLERFEIALAHVVLWHRPRHQKVWRTSPPDAFPELNGGVILFRKSDRVLTFLKDWREAYHSTENKTDQFTLRELMWLSDLRLYVFPPQYNKRVFEASELLYSDAPKARILHLPLLAPQKSKLKAWLANKLR